MSKKHFPFCGLVGVKGERIEVVDYNITDEQFERYKLLQSQLTRFASFKDDFHIVEINAFEAQSAIHQFTKDTRREIPSAERRFIKLNLNRVVINFISSFSTYLWHADKRLKRTYGDDSAQVSELKVMTSHEFDTCFEYRFIYHLRNRLHYAMPLNHIKMKARLNDHNESEYQYVVGFDLHKFSQEDYDWKKVREDLSSRNEVLSAADVIQNAFYSIQRIYDKLLAMEAPILKDHAVELKQIIQPALDRDLTGIGIGVFDKNSDNSLTSNLVEAPYLIMRELGVLQ